MFSSLDVRDRTAEFRSIQAKFAQSKPKISDQRILHQPINQSMAANSNSIFTQSTGRISFALVGVSEKLERLTRLAKGNSIFNDASDEISQLTRVVKEELQSIDRQLSELQNKNFSNGSGSSASHSHEQLVVKQLKESLANSTLNFQSALQKRTETLKDQNQRRKQFDSATSGGSALQRRRGAGNPMASAIEELNSNESENEEIEPAQASVQRLLEPINQRSANEEYLNSRAAAVESIEGIIVELGEMYQRLITLVGMQEEVTLRIDGNMEQTLENVTQGHQQLLQYFDSLSGNRSLIVKLFAILIVFIFFFMIFIA